MPVAAGVMQSPRVTVVGTTVTLTSITPPASAQCGDDIEFFFSVTSSNPLYTVDDGYVTIIDLNTSTEIGGGFVLSGTGSTGLISGLSGLLNIVAKYEGTYNQFSPSISSAISYPIVRQNTNITIANPVSNTIYCYYSPLNVDINVQGVLGDFPSGNVYLRVYYNDDDYTEIGPEELDPLNGNAIVTIPSETGDNDGYSRYLQVIYEGNSCFSPSSTYGGTLGREIIPIDIDPEITISLSVSTPPVSLSSEPINVWKLDESSGSVAADDKLNKDLTYKTSGVMIPFPGQIEGCSFFNGFSNAAIYSDSVSDPAFANYTASSTFSFSAWFKTDLLDSSNNPIVSRMSYDFSRGYALMVNAGIVSFYLNANWNTETLYAQSDIDTYNDGEWHHVVVTYDGNASSSSITMYIDGELASTTVTESSFTTSSNIEASDIAADFMIGVIGTWDGAQHSNFNGYIDDVARWDIVLTEEDASLIYTYGISGNSVASISGSGGAYHIDDPITFTATVSTDLLPPPDGYDGYVLFSYTNPISISYNELGTVYPENGLAELIVPGDTFPSTGSWQIVAEFYAENQCYDSGVISDDETIEIVP